MQSRRLALAPGLSLRVECLEVIQDVFMFAALPRRRKRQDVTSTCYVFNDRSVMNPPPEKGDSCRQEKASIIGALWTTRQKSITTIVRTTETTVKSSLYYQQRKEDAALSIGKSNLHYSKVDELLLKLMLHVGLSKGKSRLYYSKVDDLLFKLMLLAGLKTYIRWSSVVTRG